MQIIKVASNSKVSAVAGSIAHAIRENGRTQVQGIGAGAVHQMTKAVIKANQFLIEDNIFITFVPDFVQLEIGGKERTAMRLTIEAYSLRLDSVHKQREHRIEEEDEELDESSRREDKLTKQDNHRWQLNPALMLSER